MLTSANDLPADILAHIFLLGARDHPVVESSFIFPLLVSHISRRWRALALSNGLLWSTISMVGLANSHQLHRCYTWIRRSMNCTLHIHLDSRDYDWDWVEENHRFQSGHMKEVIRLILPHVHRWKRLELLTDTWEPIYVFLQQTERVATPNLGSMTLMRCNAYQVLPGGEFEPQELSKPLILFNGNAPLLREVVLQGVHVSWTKSLFQNLRTLSLCYQAQDVSPSLSDFVKLLNSSPALEELKIMGWGIRSVSDLEDEDHNEYERIIYLPQLRSFSLGFVDAEHACRFLTLFDLPNISTVILEDLYNALHNDLSLSECSAVLRSITRSANLRNVDRLELRFLRCCYPDFALFLAKFDNLRALSVDTIEETLLDALCSRDNYGNITNPRLSCVEMQGMDDVVSFVDTCLCSRGDTSSWEIIGRNEFVHWQLTSIAATD